MSVYVSNISWDTNQETLENEFAKFGTVKNVNLKEENFRRKPAYAFVEFTTVDCVEKAIAASTAEGGIKVDDRELKVEARQRRKQNTAPSLRPGASLRPAAAVDRGRLSMWTTPEPEWSVHKQSSALFVTSTVGLAN